MFLVGANQGNSRCVYVVVFLVVIGEGACFDSGLIMF